jgi:hypothetical protein
MQRKTEDTMALRFLSLRTIIALGVVGMVAVGGMFGLPRWSHADPPSTASATGVAGLQQQRIETLRRASDVAHRMYEQGAATAGEMFRIDRLLLDAQLESAASVRERTIVLKNALEVAQKQEELASRQHEAGAAGPLVPLEAKADRLRLEIELSKSNAK